MANSRQSSNSGTGTPRRSPSQRRNTRISRLSGATHSDDTLAAGDSTPPAITTAVAVASPYSIAREDERCATDTDAQAAEGEASADKVVFTCQDKPCSDASSSAASLIEAARSHALLFLLLLLGGAEARVFSSRALDEREAVLGMAVPEEEVVVVVVVVAVPAVGVMTYMGTVPVEVEVEVVVKAGVLVFVASGGVVFVA
jgi:hypothetical protein